MKDNGKFLCVSTALMLAVTSAHGREEAFALGPFPEELVTWPFSENTVVQQFEYFPIRRAGRLSACSFEFSLWSRDWAYRNNQPIWAVGSINYLLHSAVASSVVLKLHVLDYENRDGTAWVSNGDVHFAYVDIDELSLSSSTRETPSDEVASYFQAPDSDMSLLFALMRAEKLVVWFNRKDGGADLQLTIPVAEYEKQRREFHSCGIELLGVALREGEALLQEEPEQGHR